MGYAKLELDEAACEFDGWVFLKGDLVYHPVTEPDKVYCGYDCMTNHRLGATPRFPADAKRPTEGGQTR